MEKAWVRSSRDMAYWRNRRTNAWPFTDGRLVCTDAQDKVNMWRTSLWDSGRGAHASQRHGRWPTSVNSRHPWQAAGQGRQAQVLNGHVDSRIQFRVPGCVRLSLSLSLSRPVGRIFNPRRAVRPLHPFLSDLT
jgi:hypothetical protein